MGIDPSCAQQVGSCAHARARPPRLFCRVAPCEDSVFGVWSLPSFVCHCVHMLRVGIMVGHPSRRKAIVCIARPVLDLIANFTMRAPCALMFFLVSCMPILGNEGKRQFPTGSRMDVSFFAEVPWSWRLFMAGNTN